MRKPTLEILFQDEHFIAINKPAGLATIPGRGEDTSVLQQLAMQIKLPSSGTLDPRLRIVHRLDKGTSGVLLFAKNTHAQRHVSHQFHSNQTTKEYLALVAGHPIESTGQVDAPLAHHPTAKLRMAIASHGGRPAITLWHVQATFRDYTLLRVHPRTGKTHQIRVHLQHIGLPLAIDPLYNAPPPGKSTGIFLSKFKQHYSPTRGEEERPLINRLTLHAQKLRFIHLDGREIEIIAPIPKDLKATLNMLSRHSPSRTTLNPK